MFSGQSLVVRWGVQVVSRYLLLLRSQVSYGHTDNSTLHDSKLADTKYFMRALFSTDCLSAGQIRSNILSLVSDGRRGHGME